MGLIALPQPTQHFGRGKSTGKYRVSELSGNVDADLSFLFAGGMPRFFSHCAVTRELHDMIVELCPSTTSGGLAENIKHE